MMFWLDDPPEWWKPYFHDSPLAAGTRVKLVEPTKRGTHDYGTVTLKRYDVLELPGYVSVLIDNMSDIMDFHVQELEVVS